MNRSDRHTDPPVVITARQSILARLAAGLSALPALDVPDRSAPQPEPSGTEQIAAFCARLQALSVTCEVAENPVVARLGLVTYLQSQGVKRILSWSDDELPVPGIVPALDVLGIATVIPHARPLDPTLAQLDAIDVGLTGADAAFADTGALVLRGGPGRPLLVANLARHHIVLLAQSRIFAQRAAGLVALPTLGQSPSLLGRVPIAIITGPSQTLDIELTPAVGLHGARQLHVIVVGGI